MNIIQEVARSQAQQKFMTLVYLHKTGRWPDKLGEPSDAIKKASASMSIKDLKDFMKVDKDAPKKIGNRKKPEKKEETPVAKKKRHVMLRKALIGLKKAKRQIVKKKTLKETYYTVNKVNEESERHPALKRAGVSGFNKAKRTPGHPKKSHIVVAKQGDKIKTIRFGEQGAETAGAPKKGESERMKKKRASFKARHGKNIAKGKMSAAYWADKVKW